MLRHCLLCLLSTILLSCLSEPDCILTASNEVKISLEKLTADSARFVIFDRIEVSGTDSVFYEGDSVDYVVLPVHPGNSQTTFRFYYETREDSIQVTYTRSTQVISPDCGAFNYFQDLAVILSTFSTTTVARKELSTNEAPNLIIKL